MMKQATLTIAVVLLALSAFEGNTIVAQAPSTPAAAQTPGRVVTFDPALDAIIAPGTVVEKVAGGFGFVEGPVWTRDGALLFSDLPANAIMKLTPGGQAAVFRQPSGYTGEPRQPGSHVGSNGLTLDREGRLIIAEHGDRRVSRIEANGQVTVVADKYDGKRLNSPNDAVVRSDGSIYFTDPPVRSAAAGQGPGQGTAVQRHLPHRRRQGAAAIAGSRVPQRTWFLA